MAKYNHTTLEEFRNDIAKALGDDFVFWTAPAIDKNIEEALLTFGAISGFWKEKFFINLVEDKKLYDIFTDCIDVSLIAPSLTYQKIIDWISNDIIETIPSALLTENDLLSLIEARYNKFQLLTGLVLSTSNINIGAQNNRYILNDSIIEIIRLKLTDSEENSIILQGEDEAGLSYFDQAALLGDGIPEYYSTIYGSPNELIIYPTPNVNGQIEIISVSGQDTAINVDANTLINLPNNLVPYLKFGVEEDIFGKDGLLNDKARAEYCGERWKEGIVIGRNYASILSTKVNGVSLMRDSLFSMNLYNALRKTRDVPAIIGIAGFNIFETDILPANDQHSIELVMQHNAPIPTLNGDKIDVELGYVDIILAYVLHLAHMKGGSSDLLSSIGAREMLIKSALMHNERLQLRGITFEDVVTSSKKEERDQPKIPVEN